MKNKSIRVVDDFLSLLFVPKCVHCKERLLPGEDVFCPICRAKWESAKNYPCRGCGEGMGHCLCKPNAMLMHDVEALIKLGYYQPSKRDQIVNQVIFQIKRGNNRRLNRFIAEQLAQGIRRVYGDCAGWMLTYAPRRAAGIKKYGYDQAKALAREIAQALGLECRALFEVNRHAREQKALNASERIRNAEVSFSIADGIDVAGRCVMIVDDVATSGATIGRCAQLLKVTGADCVAGVVIAAGKL